MRTYHEIRTEDDMKILVGAVGGFHDTRVADIYVTNRDGLRLDRGNYASERLDAQVLVRIPWDPFAVELVFIDIHGLDARDGGWCDGASFRTRPIARSSEKTELTVEFSPTVRIVAGRMFYRVRREWREREVRLGPVPSPDAVVATAVEGDWRQCSSCANIWEEHLDCEFSLCPECHAFTELYPGSDLS